MEAQGDVPPSVHVGPDAVTGGIAQEKYESYNVTHNVSDKKGKKG